MKLVRRVVARITGIRVVRLVAVAAVLTLVGLAFMVWSLVDPTPLPVILAMSVGQVLGTIAFALYAIAVAKDFLSSRRAREDAGP